MSALSAKDMLQRNKENWNGGILSAAWKEMSTILFFGFAAFALSKTQLKFKVSHRRRVKEQLRRSILAHFQGIIRE